MSWKSRRMLWSLLTIAACVYAALCVFFFVFQRSFIYMPTPATPEHDAATVLQMPDARLRLSTRPLVGPKALVYFGGNAEDVAATLPELAAAFPDRAIYALHYRGYSGSSGHPAEAAMRNDARELFRLVHGRHPDVMAVGRSLDEYLERNRSLADVVPDLHVNVPAGVFAGFTMGTHDGMRALERSLDDAFPGRLSLHTIRSPRYRDWMCEIAPAGVTKWSGVLAIASQWGIDAAHICAVGDDVNDLPMIRGAGCGIAMGNARPEVLAAADRVVGPHDGDGLLDVADLLLGDR